MSSVWGQAPSSSAARVTSHKALGILSYRVTKAGSTGTEKSRASPQWRLEQIHPCI